MVLGAYVIIQCGTHSKRNREGSFLDSDSDKTNKKAAVGKTDWWPCSGKKETENG